MLGPHGADGCQVGQQDPTCNLGLQGGVTAQEGLWAKGKSYTGQGSGSASGHLLAWWHRQQQEPDSWAPCAYLSPLALRVDMCVCVLTTCVCAHSLCVCVCSQPMCVYVLKNHVQAHGLCVYAYLQLAVRLSPLSQAS